MRKRHLAFYLAFAEKARPELAGPEQGTWLARLDLERENILAAHAFCDQRENGADERIQARLRSQDSTGSIAGCSGSATE